MMDENTVLVQNTLRSGQSVYYDGNVVVVGDINPGGEVIAAGNVVVMGYLRGMVHAGVGGNEGAVVYAFRMCPTQLRIASHITRAPDDDCGPTVPEIARIKEGRVVIETFSVGPDR